MRIPRFLCTSMGCRRDWRAQHVSSLSYSRKVPQLERFHGWKNCKTLLKVCHGMLIQKCQHMACGLPNIGFIRGVLLNVGFILVLFPNDPLFPVSEKYSPGWICCVTFWVLSDEVTLCSPNCGNFSAPSAQLLLGLSATGGTSGTAIAKGYLQLHAAF